MNCLRQKPSMELTSLQSALPQAASITSGGRGEPPTSCSDLLGLLGSASWVEGVRKPPMSCDDSLVVGPDVVSGREKRAPNKS